MPLAQRRLSFTKILQTLRIASVALLQEQWLRFECQ